MSKILNLALRIIPAVILLQTLYFKFTAHPSSVHIFETLNAEPFGRIATGVFELFAGVLLLVPSTAVFGAVIAAGLMAGAIGSHLLFLGISVQGDGGELFGLAVIVFVLSCIIIIKEKNVLLQFIKSRFEKAN